MKPIISPWWIYLIDLFNNLKEAFGVALFLLGCTAVALLIIWLLVLWIIMKDLLLHVKSI